MLALPILPGRPKHCRAVRVSPVDCHRRKKPTAVAEGLCWRYLSSRAVARQVLSAQMSLTSVFGMGTGGPSSQSTPTHMDGCYPSFILRTPCALIVSPYKLKAQRSGFQFEATNLDAVEKTSSLVFDVCIKYEELVTHTGFEPMLTA